MAFYDFPYDQLVSYKPQRNEPADFDAFWQDTLAEADAYALNPRFTPVDAGLEDGGCVRRDLRGLRRAGCARLAAAAAQRSGATALRG